MVSKIERPLVSVLIATYNQKEVVAETVESVIRQTYQSTEIIISDDCSVDGTGDVLRSICLKYPKIKLYLQSKNLGVTGNYNFLASLASGDYVSIFSGDDVMLPNKLEMQVEVLEKNPEISFCHHAVYDIEYNSGNVRGIITQKYKNNRTSIEDLLRNMGVPGSMSIVYRKSMAPDPVFDPSIGTASDWLNMIQLASKGGGVFLDQPLCLYRRDDGYNKKDPTKYEQDFIETINIARRLYSDGKDSIAAACDYALARFYMGAGYRRMERGDNEISRAYFSMARRHPQFITQGLVLALFSYLPVGQAFLLRFKKLYKKFSK